MTGARARSRALVAAALVGCVLRLAFALGYWTGKPLTHDEREYLQLGANLAAGRPFEHEPPEAASNERFGRAPGYPAFIALVAGTGAPEARVRRVQIAQALLGALTVPLLAALAARAAGPHAAVPAAWLTAVYPPLIWMPAYVLSETLYSALALAGVLWVSRIVDGPRREAVARPASPWALVTAGLLGGLAALTRPAHLFFLLLLGLWFLRARRPGRAALVAVGALLVIAPWTARNAAVLGRPVLIASEGGVTFWTGNHPLSRGEGDLAANPAIKRDNERLRAEHPGLSPEALEPIYYGEAFAAIGSHPVWWAGLLARKVFYLFVPVGPSYTLHSPRYLAASLVSYGLLFPLGVGGLFWVARHGWPPRALGLLACSAVVACIVFLPQERFRIPVIDPTLLVGAAAVFTVRPAPRTSPAEELA